MSDAEAVLIYATENSTQRGESSTAGTGTVASATWFLTRLAARETVAEISAKVGWSKQEAAELKKAFGDKGVGWRSALHFLRNVPGIKRPAIEDYFANIKACGEYAKIIGDVRKEIDTELAEELRKAEEARKEEEPVR